MLCKNVDCALDLDNYLWNASGIITSLVAAVFMHMSWCKWGKRLLEVQHRHRQKQVGKVWILSYSSCNSFVEFSSWIRRWCLPPKTKQRKNMPETWVRCDISGFKSGCCLKCSIHVNICLWASGPGWLQQKQAAMCNWMWNQQIFIFKKGHWSYNLTSVGSSKNITKQCKRFVIIS